jgi:hypothetical protein
VLNDPSNPVEFELHPVTSITTFDKSCPPLFWISTVNVVPVAAVESKSDEGYDEEDGN